MLEVWVLLVHSVMDTLPAQKLSIIIEYVTTIDGVKYIGDRMKHPNLVHKQKSKEFSKGF
jgi:hypothetical protein